MKSTPIRIDGELYAAATQAAPLQSRTTAQQIAHWARVGRALESSPGVSLQDILKALRAPDQYDRLREEEQAIVRAAWNERMRTLGSALRLDEAFRAQGRPYAELDAKGNVVVHEPETDSPQGKPVRTEG